VLRALHAAAIFFLGGCSLVGGLGGDFKPIEDGGLGGGAPATCEDHVKNGAETDVDCGGGTCSQCSLGQSCAKNADCASGYCIGGACAPASCSDGVKNGTETGVDCGGECPTACPAGAGCVIGADCASDHCVTGKCAAATCSDGIQNEGEIAVDCQGSMKCPCAIGQPCTDPAQCASGTCAIGGVCQPATCDDGKRDGNETDVDCGGACSPCPDGKACGMGSDCTSGVCKAGLCQVATCSDGVKNGMEPDVDCGTACATPCADGKGCFTSADCASAVCAMGVCKAPSCNDGVKNGMETSVDCGGGCPCDAGAACSLASDCKSGVCTGGTCQVPSCTDGVKNGTETATDCGGSCPGCASGQACKVASDCQSVICTGGMCQAGTCADGIQNEGETDVDCGGPCPACATGEGCAKDADCKGGLCFENTCAPTCTDGVQNEGESDVDCGGPSCPECTVGKACAAMSDCASALCSAKVCKAASCTDGVKDGSESDVDCGGSCSPCANGKRCNFAEDCGSGACTAGQEGGSCGPWVRAYGPLSGPWASALTVQPSGLVVASTVVAYPGIDFGGGTLSNVTDANSVLFALSRAGQYAWSKNAETTCDARIGTLVSDGTGNLFALGGTLSSSCDFGGGPVAAAYLDMFTAKYSSSASVVWADVWGLPQMRPGNTRAAVAPNGDVVFGGWFSGATSTFGATVLNNPSPPNGAEAFVARLAADGTPLWAKAVGAAPNNDYINGVAVDASGDVFLTGAYITSVDFGPPCAPLTGGFQGYVAKLSSTGQCIWAQTAGITDTYGLALDGNGDVVVLGLCGNAVSLGGKVLNDGPAGLWLVKLDPTTGSAIWGSQTPNVSGVTGARLALDPAGNAIVTGSFTTSLNDFGGGPLVNQGGSDVYVVAHSGANGQYLFSKGFGGAGDDVGTDVATDPVTGNVVVTGYFQDTVDFGTGPVAAQNPYSTFLLSLGPVP
jgi:hypothetical protein